MQVARAIQPEVAHCRFCDHVETGSSLQEALIALGTHVQADHPEEAVERPQKKGEIIPLKNKT